MRQIDLEILYFFNQLAGEVPLLDNIILFISVNHLFKGGVIVLFLWYLWFNKENKKEYRPKIILTVIGCFITILLARILALTLPFRLRPLHNPPEGFSMPFEISTKYADGMSSFPSDHAALFVALATGVYFISKRLGVFALIYALVVICLPRIYLGIHYLSDIIGGAILGAITIFMLFNYGFSRKLAFPIYKWKKEYNEVFYCLFFLITYQIADMFESARAILRFTADLIGL